MAARAAYFPTATCMFAAVVPNAFRLWLGSHAAVRKRTMQDFGISCTLCADQRFLEFYKNMFKPPPLPAPKASSIVRVASSDCLTIFVFLRGTCQACSLASANDQDIASHRLESSGAGGGSQ